jgi:ABC-2 type transport system ATP-binding protein
MIIHLESITKSYGDTRALKGITLEVGAGQVLGYIGPNGAGKTTTVKILTAVLRPDTGIVKVCGFDAVAESLEVKKRVGYVPEAAALYESMTPMEYGRFVGRLQRLDESALDRRLERFLSIFGLHENRHDPLATFSKGMKQKVAVLTALLHNPPLVILDEPLNGLDANTALLMKEIIARLADEGRTVFYCSHLLDVVERVCHRVVILKEGEILADGTVDEVRQTAGGSTIESAFSTLTSTTDWAALAGEFVKELDSSGRP